MISNRVPSATDEESHGYVIEVILRPSKSARILQAGPSKGGASPGLLGVRGNDELRVDVEFGSTVARSSSCWSLLSAGPDELMSRSYEP